MSSYWPDHTAPGRAARAHLYPVVLMPPIPGAQPARHANLAVAPPDGLAEMDDDGNAEVPVAVMRLACSCGWQSPLLEPSPATRCITSRVGAAPRVLVPEGEYYRYYALWDAHRRPTGSPQ
jgi:hypothetical protein